MKKLLFGYNAWGKYKVELEINADLGREFTQKDERNAREHAENLISALMEETYTLDPKNKEEAEKERKGILGLFGDRAIFVEELPNGYCNRYCCKHLPWFDVTTNKGRIKIGWRKRVIHIDWEKSIIKENAETLFPDEDVTKFDKGIHAWGLEKAKEYIDKLMGLEKTPEHMEWWYGISDNYTDELFFKYDMPKPPSDELIKEVYLKEKGIYK